MRKAFSLIEIMIVIAIASIVLAIVASVVDRQFSSGKTVMWQGQKVYIVACDVRTSPTTYLIRLPDNREMRVIRAELTPIAVKAERE